jgi:hypothetical protein
VAPTTLALLSLAFLAFAVPQSARADDTLEWQVSGTMQESGSKGTATGDLAGPYTVRFLKVVNNGDGTTSVVSRRTITTAQGRLVLDETGTLNNATGEVSVFSVVSGGNGIFAGASGQLDLSGQQHSDGSVSLTYAGEILLED